MRAEEPETRSHRETSSNTEFSTSFCPLEPQLDHTDLTGTHTHTHTYMYTTTYKIHNKMNLIFIYILYIFALCRISTEKL